MNEVEIVDVVLGILIESCKQEKVCEQLVLVGVDNLEYFFFCFVLFYISFGSSSEEEDSGKQVLVLGFSFFQRLGGFSFVCSRSFEEEEEEDVLKYVWEIFFSQGINCVLNCLLRVVGGQLSFYWCCWVVCLWEWGFLCFYFCVFLGLVDLFQVRSFWIFWVLGLLF